MSGIPLHLDTSFLIRALIPASAENSQLRKWLEEDRTPMMSTVAWAEFLCGPLRDRHLEQATLIVEDHLPFTSDDAALAAELFNGAGRKRRLFRDCLIAATALHQGAELATSNQEDFQRLGVPLAR